MSKRLWPSAALTAVAGVGAMILVSCGSSSTGGYSSDKPDAILGIIASAVEATGSGMTTSRREKNGSRLSSLDCDANGDPVGLSQSDPRYPGVFTYCQLTVNKGGTVRGGFSTPKSVTCLLERLNVVYDGVERSVTVDNASAVACFGDAEEGPSTMTATVTASSPFAGNTNFERGAIISAPDINLVFKIAANVSGTKISFITHEHWTDEDSYGANHGTYDTATGQLWFEGRWDRKDCETESRCGWNRHPRILADLTVNSAGIPAGLETVSFGYSNIQQPPGQDGFGGVLITASGALATGIKARLWQATDGGSSKGAPTSLADYQVVGNWSEVANTKCFTSTSEDATGCGDGLDKFTDNTKFAMEDNEMQTEAWFAARPAVQSFTAVDVNSDVQ